MKEQVQIFKPIKFEKNPQNSISLTNTCYVIGFYPKCHIVVTGETRLITIYEIKFGRLQQIQTLLEHKDHVVTFCFMNNTLNFASGSWDSSIRIWKQNPNNKLWFCEQILEDSGYLNQIIINKQESLLISCGFAKQITFWAKKTQWECFQVLKVHQSNVWSISLNESCNQLVSCGNDSKIIVSSLGDQNL